MPLRPVSRGDAQLLLTTKQDLFKWHLKAKPGLLFASAYGMIAAPIKEDGSWPRSEIILEREQGYWWSSWMDIASRGKESLIYQAGYKQQYAVAARRLVEACQRVEEWQMVDFSNEQFNHAWHQFFIDYTHFWSVAVAGEVAGFGGYYDLENLLLAEHKPASWASQLAVAGLPMNVEEERDLLRIALAKHL